MSPARERCIRCACEARVQCVERVRCEQYVCAVRVSCWERGGLLRGGLSARRAVRGLSRALPVSAHPCPAPAPGVSEGTPQSLVCSPAFTMERVLSALSGVGTQTYLQFGVVVASAVSIMVAELTVGLAALVAEGNGVSSTQGMSRKVSLESGLRKGVAFAREPWGWEREKGRCKLGHSRHAPHRNLVLALGPW